MPRKPRPESEAVTVEILRLKKTESKINGAPMGYREIGTKLGLTAMGVKWHTRHHAKGRCPMCLRPLEKNKDCKS